MKRLTWGQLPYRRSDRLLPLLGAALIFALGGCGGDDGQEGGCPPDIVGNNNFEAQASFIDTVNVASQSQITLVGVNGRVTIRTRCACRPFNRHVTREDAISSITTSPCR